MPLPYSCLYVTGVDGHDRVCRRNITVKRRGYKKMPLALRDAIASNAIFGGLLFPRALL
jgi:hypothetical protein